MKKSKGEAKFFCESCGSEVPSKAKVCPVCGKFFASVRCPKCGCTGESEDFIKGCPSCGYAMRPEDLYPDGGYSSNYSSGNNKNNKGGFFSSSGKKHDSSYGDSSLPFWVYLIPIAVLVVLIICFYSCF